MDVKKLAENLRKVADAVERMDDQKSYFGVSVHVGLPEDFRALARVITPFKKEPSDYYYKVVTEDSTVTLMIDRERVCRRVKVMKEVEVFECDDSILDPTPE